MEGTSTCPQVFVVDSQVSTSLPPSSAPFRVSKLAWRLLFMLVFLALFGVAVEACFMYYLYNRSMPQEDSGSASAHKGFSDLEGNNVEVYSSKGVQPNTSPLKPSAHLTANIKDGVLTWGKYGDAFLHDMQVKDNQLQVSKEGYYYIYSSVLFSEPPCGPFKHTVLRHTPRYGSDLSLMTAKRYMCDSSQKTQRRNMLTSYLGGIFHLYAGDSLSIKLENRTLVRHQDTTDNFFGAFMV